MKSAFLMLVFGWLAAGLQCPANSCHPDIAHADASGQTEKHGAQTCCDCLGCKPHSAIEVFDGKIASLLPAEAETLHQEQLLCLGVVYPDGPFHPPRV